MTSKEAIDRITDILIKSNEADPSTAKFLAETIYADVVSTAVDDERNLWITMASRDTGRDC